MKAKQPRKQRNVVVEIRSVDGDYKPVGEPFVFGNTAGVPDSCVIGRQGKQKEDNLADVTAAMGNSALFRREHLLLLVDKEGNWTIKDVSEGRGVMVVDLRRGLRRLLRGRPKLSSRSVKLEPRRPWSFDPQKEAVLFGTCELVFKRGWFSPAWVGIIRRPTSRR